MIVQTEYMIEGYAMNGWVEWGPGYTTLTGARRAIKLHWRKKLGDYRVVEITTTTTTRRKVMK